MGGVSVWRWVLLLASVTAGLVAYVFRPGVRTSVPDRLSAPSRAVPATASPSKAEAVPKRMSTKAELLEQARDLEIRGRSKMTKEELMKAIRSRSDKASQNHASPAR